MTSTPIDPDNPASQHSEDTPNSERSAHCTNCGTLLNGKFCHQCGQSSRSMIKFFGEVLKEILDDVIGYDSRLKHSILPLLFQPGKLSKEYVQGRRFYYVMPFRLYLFTSILFILVLQFSAKGVNFLPEVQPADSSHTPTEINSSQTEITANKTNLSAEKSGQNHSENKASNKPEALSHANGNGIRHNKLQQPPQFINMSTDNPKLKQIMAEINLKAESWKKDPSPLFDEFFQLFPYMMFIILPVFAIFSKLFYLFSDKYYVEHLIFSLHNHSFIYIAMIIEIGLGALQPEVKTANFSITNMFYETIEWMNLFIFLWIIAYIFLATRRFYQQGWVMTISKTLALGLIYIFLASVGLVITLIVGAYLA